MSGPTNTPDLGTAASKNVDTLDGVASTFKVNIVAPELSPYQEGATGGDADKDTAGWNAVLLKAQQQKRPVQASGTFFIRPNPVSAYDYNKVVGGGMHNSIQMRSGVRVYGRDLTLCVDQPVGWTPGASERIALFGAPFSMTLNGLTYPHFEDITFDFRNERWPAVHSFIYAFAAIGVTGMTRRNINVINTGTEQRGRGLLIDNAIGCRDEGLVYRNCTQGTYFHYNDEYTLRGLDMDTFVEGLDFDLPCIRPDISGLRFRNGTGESQCVDWTGIVGGQLRDMVAHNVKSLVYVYDKPTNFPTFADYYAALDSGAMADPATAIVSNSVIIDGITATSLNSTGDDTIRIANYREEGDGTPRGNASRDLPVLRDITVRNVFAQGGNRILVNEGLRVKLHNIVAKNFSPGTDATNGAAVVFRQSLHSATAIANSAVSGELYGIEVIDSQGQGVSVNSPSDLKMDAINVNGWNLQGNTNTSRGVRIERLHTKPGVVTIGEIKTNGKLVESVNDLLITATLTSPVTSRINLVGPLSLRSTATTSNQADIRVGLGMTPTLIPLGTFDTRKASAGAANVIVAQTVARASQMYQRVVRAAILVNKAVAGDATNYSRFYLRRSRAGALVSLSGTPANYDSVARSVDTEVELPIGININGTVMEPGDTLHVVCDSIGGTGSLVDGVSLLLVTVPYTKVGS